MPRAQPLAKSMVKGSNPVTDLQPGLCWLPLISAAIKGRRKHEEKEKAK